MFHCPRHRPNRKSLSNYSHPHDGIGIHPMRCCDEIRRGSGHHAHDDTRHDKDHSSARGHPWNVRDPHRPFRDRPRERHQSQPAWRKIRRAPRSQATRLVRVSRKRSHPTEVQAAAIELPESRWATENASPFLTWNRALRQQSFAYLQALKPLVKAGLKTYAFEAGVVSVSAGFAASLPASTVAEAVVCASMRGWGGV